MRIWVSLLIAAGLCHADVEDRTKVERSFTLPPGARKIIVDNIQGSILLTGVPGNDVQVKIDQYWRADDDARMADAKRDVKLDIKQDGGIVKLYVDGPFRCNDGVNWRGDSGYGFTFDFELRVPQGVDVELRTINKGRIVASDIGNFSVRNVNGRVDLSGVAGSGLAHTVNGPVTVKFVRNPEKASSFKTVNGELAVTYPPGLNSDVRIKSMRGDAFTDFETSVLPSVVESSREGGRFLFRSSHGSTRLRIGSGGPEQSFELINGTIRILKDKQ